MCASNSFVRPQGAAAPSGSFSPASSDRLATDASGDDVLAAIATHHAQPLGGGAAARASPARAPGHARGPSRQFRELQPAVLAAAYQAPPPRDMMRARSEALHAHHRGEQLYDYGAFGDVAPPPDGPLERLVAAHGRKRVSRSQRAWLVLTTWRLPNSQLTLGAVLAILLYFLLNLVCLLVVKRPGSNEPDYERGFGSLAGSVGLRSFALRPATITVHAHVWCVRTVANTMLLIVPATRNSVLTWLLHLPFDQVACVCSAVFVFICRSTTSVLL